MREIGGGSASYAEPRAANGAAFEGRPPSRSRRSAASLAFVTSASNFTRRIVSTYAPECHGIRHPCRWRMPRTLLRAPSRRDPSCIRHRGLVVLFRTSIRGSQAGACRRSVRALVSTARVRFADHSPPLSR